eukprot:Rmarinus@m.23381
MASRAGRLVSLTLRSTSWSVPRGYHAMAPRVSVSSLSRSISTTFTTRMCEKQQLSPDSVQERVLKVVREFEKVDPSRVSAEAHFQKDLSLDSLDVVELVLCMEDEFGIEIEDPAADKMFTVPDVVQYVIAHPEAK